MSVSQVTPTTPVAWIPTQTWLQKHERLILGTMVLALATFGCSRWFDKSAMDAQMNAAIAAKVAAQADADKKQTDAATAQVIAQANQQATLLQAQVESDKQTIASLVATVASRDAAESTRVAVVSGVRTPPQAVSDLSTVYTLAVPIVPTDTGANVPTADLQQFTVAKIEGDTAKADLATTKQELSAAQDEITNDESIIVNKEKIIAQDAITLKAHDDSAAADAKAAAEKLTAVKKQARKSKLHWFEAGFVAGAGSIIAAIIH